MIPYKWPVATAIPQNPAVRREIARAMQAFLEEGDERLRQRRAEIASLRQGLAELAQDIARFRRDAPALLLSELRKYGYNPEEPRVPKHSEGGGRWTSVGAADGTHWSEAPSVQIAAAGWPRCEGFSAGCQSGGSYGTTAMFYIHGRALCMDCAVKILEIQNETGSEKVRILSPYYLDK